MSKRRNMTAAELSEFLSIVLGTLKTQIIEVDRSFLERAAELLKANIDDETKESRPFYSLGQCQDPDGEFWLVCAGTRIIARCGKLPGVDVATDITGRALLQLVADANAGRISNR